MKIVGISIDKRTDSAPKVQEILTKYGDKIIGRFGVHDPEDEHGVITLNVVADNDYINNLEEEIKKLDGVKMKYMDL